MGHHHKHHVKIHKWVRGVLQVVEHEFANLADAVTFANNQQRTHEKTIYEGEVEQVVKIYDTEDNSLVTTVGAASQDTYA